MSNYNPNAAQQRILEKMNLFADDERLFQIYVHDTDNQLYVGPHSTYNGCNQDAIAFGWDNGLIIRVLPDHVPPHPKNINDYFLEVDLVNALIQVPESTKGKSVHLVEYTTLEVSTEISIDNNENQTNLWISADFGERSFDSSSARSSGGKLPENVDEVWSGQDNVLKSLYISTSSTSKKTKDQIRGPLSDSEFMTATRRDRIEFFHTGGDLNQLVEYIKAYQVNKDEVDEDHKHMDDKEFSANAITVSWTKHADDLY